MKKAFPYKFLQKGFTDADYQIYFKGDKLVVEYLIDGMWGWSRDIYDYKIEGGKVFGKLISSEEQERFNDPLKTVKFNHHFTVKDGKYVEKKSDFRCKKWYAYEISYNSYKWNKENFKADRHELKFLIPGAVIYVIYHTLGKEKAKEYCDNELRRFNRGYRFRQYREKSSKILKKYNTERIYIDGYFDYDDEGLSERDEINMTKELESLKDEYVLWDFFRMGLRIQEREEMRDIAEQGYPEYYKKFPRYRMTLEQEVRESINGRRKRGK